MLRDIVRGRHPHRRSGQRSVTRQDQLSRGHPAAGDPGASGYGPSGLTRPTGLVLRDRSRVPSSSSRGRHPHRRSG
ncbi:MAG: hypothetical protein MZV70_63530 [Desulfobacterales bacterium]|nr:hypothetical protein [Desulfobacterales bacterium]